MKNIKYSNGWHKIESPEDYPKEEGKYLILLNDDSMDVAFFGHYINGPSFNDQFTDFDIDEIKAWQFTPTLPNF